MTFEELLDLATAEALASRLEPTEDYAWRKICRQYSKKFFTPLHEVFAMNPEEVALHVFEDTLETFDTDEHMEQLLDLIYTLEDPEYAKHKEEEMQEFINDAVREEQERTREGRPIHPALGKDQSSGKLNSKAEIRKEASLPAGGMVDLSYLDKNDNER
jgi:hypothetical protein